MARPRVHDEATGEALLAEALGILRDQGPDAISVRAVADAAGTSVRAVYTVFGSKQALIDGLADLGYHRLIELVDSVPRTDDPAHDLVTAGITGFRSFAVEEPALFRLTFEQVSADVLQRVGPAARDSYEALRRRVWALREAGGIHPDRGDAQCCFAFHAACQGLAGSELAARRPPAGPGMWPMLGPDQISTLWADTLTAVVAGFAAPPAG